PEADEPDVATTATATDAAPGRDHGSTRRLLESVITYLGLDAASFGDVDDDVRAEAAPATAAPPPLRITRLAAFLGFDLGADDNLYRPSRRPRSPRRAWRDRVASRG